MILPGQVLKENKVKNKHGFFEVKNGPQPGEIDVNFSGLTVAICGGGMLKKEQAVYRDIQELSRYIAQYGGVVVNGGENGGSMLAAAEAAPDYTLGITCPYHILNEFGPKAMVKSYVSRKMIIVSAPYVVVYTGGTGTLDELIGVIGWIKSSRKQDLKPPQAYLQNYWRDFYEILDKKGAFPPNVKSNIHFFENAGDLIGELK